MYLVEGPSPCEDDVGVFHLYRSLPQSHQVSSNTYSPTRHLYQE